MNTDFHRFLKTILLLSVFIGVHRWLIPDCLAETDPHFQKRWLTAQFFAEGANAGDFNHDGKPDVVDGPFIYEGPEFTLKHAFMEPHAYDPLAYSQNMFAFAHDFNGDGWDDILIIGFPGAEAFWYENPKTGTGEWKKHLVFKTVDNESPTLTKIVGDQPALLCCNAGTIGYAAPDSADPTKPWQWHAVSPKADYQRFTHGIGAGDVNGDGRIDILEKNGWWEQPEKLDGDPVWKKHEFEFSKPGSAQMYAYDVDGDGDNDVITSLAAHGYGLAWYENTKDKNGEITFKQRLILSPDAKEKINGVQFSQLHAVDLVDMDGDGLKDIVTGKRYWAHGPGHDPEPNAPAVLYWFKLTRENGQVKYEPHLLDDNSGVGTQIVATDING